MRIRSINIGASRLIVVKGRQVPSSIVKSPVDGPVEVTPRGLVGDARVTPRSCGPLDHAVYLYPHAHYDHWQRELDVDAFPCGQFGENLTVDDMVEGDVRVGDVLQCGTTTLQVVQPRLPCAKLNARMGRRFAGTFLRSGRLGFYCRVLTPGAITAGDAITITESDPSAPTMADFIRISQHDYWDVAGLEHLLAAPGLPAWWRESLTDKLARSRAAPGWFGLRDLEIAERYDECEDTVSLWLRCPHGRALAPFFPGQHLTLALRLGDTGDVARRAYAITSNPRRTDAYRITVQLARAPSSDVPDGVVSSALVRHLKLGDRVRANAPSGALTLSKVGTDSPGVLFVSRDVGLASLIGCIHEWGERLAGVPAALVHEAESRTRVPFAVELDELRTVTNLDVHMALREPTAGDALGADYHARGPLDPDGLVRFAPPAGGHVLVAGSTSFVDAVQRALAGRDLTVCVLGYGA